MDEIVFKLRDVYFSYLGKIPALCGIDIDIARGEKIALLGANGCGKSSLLLLLDALIFPDKGSISFLGRELQEGDFSDDKFSAEFRRKVGLVFQNPDVQLFCPTVKEDIVFGPLQLGVGAREANRRLEKLAELFGIKELLERSSHQLSIGEKKKVAIASTLAIEPEILLLDEPTAGLDPRTTRHIIDLIDQAHAQGKTVITATHDLHILQELSDKVFVFNEEKRIARSGSASEILSDQEFLIEHNLVHVHRHRHEGQVHTHAHEHIDHHHPHED